MEEKRDYDKELEKKDTLMWSDEDYKSMEKLTGFSEEDAEKIKEALNSHFLAPTVDNSSVKVDNIID